jgi:hypothetical protein
VDSQVGGGLESLYAIASRVSFIAIDRVFDVDATESRLQQIENSKRILEDALAALNEGRSYESAA